MMHAGLFEARPRSRELVYVMLGQRAARALGDLRMHANTWTLEQAASSRRRPRRAAGSASTGALSAGSSSSSCAGPATGRATSSARR